MFGDERHVLASTSLDPRSHLKELVDTRVPLDHGRKRLLIQPLIHLQEEELASVHEQIQPGWEHERFIVGRWKRASPANRRDFAHILRHFSEASDRIIFLLNRPVIGEPLDTAVYEQHVHDMDSYKYGVLLRQNPEILKIWWQREPLYTAGSMSQLDKDLEFHVNPLMAFPLSLPAWYKALPLIEISRERDAGTSVPHNQRHGHSPAFYLTQSLNDEKKITAKDIIEKNNPLETGFTYIPWEGNVDGGPEDMLGAMKMVRYANRTGFTATQHEVLVFIDGQFKNDQKVIVCSWRSVHPFVH